ETNSGGRLFKSIDGGATFTGPNTLSPANGFCGLQCFYDMSPAIDPSNKDNMLIGGSAEPVGVGDTADILMRTTDGSRFSSSHGGLPSHSHATLYAPST